MNRELAINIADTIMYEGYMLYPYRPSAIKNRQRWTFGILYPPTYGEVQAGTERSLMHSECLLKTSGKAAVQVHARFLQLITKQVAERVEQAFKPVPSLMIDGQLIESWDEGVERSARLEFPLEVTEHAVEFAFPASNRSESLLNGVGEVVANTIRTQHEIRGKLCVSAEKIRNDVWKFKIDVVNTNAQTFDARDRNEALLRSMLTAHSVVTSLGGEFISLLDPPEDLRAVAASCRNVGNFPVLVGENGERDMMLCSPILLYDYPQIAPESAGDFFDATEMDEMLTLRVMTLSDDEKKEMLGDDRMRELLERTEQSAREQLMRTHGTIRGLHRIPEQS
ncbi:MAG: hypothetical protein WAM79_02860 [Candidatus Sulfotelmatobacter sp.]